MTKGTPRGAARAYFERMMAEGDRSAGCWIWPYRCTPAGYGSLQDGPSGAMTATAVHRLAFQREYGHLPFVGRHDCDTPPCFNPSHILDGTYRDNTQDSIRRGRFPGYPSRAKLTEAQMMEVRQRALAGEPQRKLGAEFGICQAQVSRIKLRQRWGHL